MNHRVFQLLLIGVVTCPVYGTWADELPPVINTPGVGPVAAPPASGQSAVSAPRVAAPAVTEKRDIESRLSRLERVLSSGTLVNMAFKLDAVEEQSRHMQGASEELSHEIEAIKRRQRDLYMDLDRRLTAIETALKNLQKSSAPAVVDTAPNSAGDSQGNPAVEPGAGGAAANAPVTVATPATAATAVVATPQTAPTKAGAPAAPAVAPAVSPLQEQSDYEAALAVLRSGDYENARQAFSKFIEAYPQGAFADNAYYWQGEADYVMRRYEDAITSFGKVLALFPDSAKVPAAMLKTGFSYYGMKQWDKAREILEKVKAQYPQGSVAQLADKRLHRMKIEGH